MSEAKYSPSLRYRANFASPAVTGMTSSSSSWSVVAILIQFMAKYSVY
ncbi:Uncharacterised protein [Bordetella pertussis]|nr:Uncharacterised protein [Bordetella pertussis]